MSPEILVDTPAIENYYPLMPMTSQFEYFEASESPDLSQYQVIRRNGELTEFNSSKISSAMTKAFLAVEGKAAEKSHRVHDVVQKLTAQIVKAVSRQLSINSKIHIEDIQDQVELALMRAGEHKIARAYVLYREDHANKRAKKKQKTAIHVTDAAGEQKPLNEKRLNALIKEACHGLEDVSVELILRETLKNLFDGIKEQEVEKALILSARTLIEKEPNYTHVTARLLLDDLRHETLNALNFDKPTKIHALTTKEMAKQYPAYFKTYIEHGIEHELLTPQLREFDIDQLGKAIQPERDLNFTYLGLQTLYDRYFLHVRNERFELPQAFFMRVAMGLAINEGEQKNERAIEFYEKLSAFDVMCSTPTLFNSGTLRPQLSSCYVSIVPDSAEGITKAISDNALLSKYAGGLGNDWTYVRGMGAHIKGTNGKSGGIIPFMKMAETGLIAFNQSGKRKGAGCAYLESWHLDIEEFLELRKNTGDERRRTHDMSTANWIPDLFMERVMNNQEWTLFSPNEVPDLHDLHGEAFKTAYENYEKLAKQGKIKLFKRMNAVVLWRKMLTMLFETGHPWMAFKDPCNIRNTQQHIGAIHSSNLCTEITLNTSENEIAVCNLASINLAQHIQNDELNADKLANTVKIAMRMLDNVIDINYYAIPEARNANMKHRPVGLGIMGFQDALYQQRIAYASQQAVDFADRAMEVISFHTISASCELAQERDSYGSFEGSLWSQGILPIESIKTLSKYRNNELNTTESKDIDWAGLSQKVKQGMRNSNCMAIAPTATISNICGVSQSIEPTYQNVYVKSNLSGEFTVVNKYLINDLKSLGLWDNVMIDDLKYYDGSVQEIDRIPNELKAIYATAFEINADWLVECAARRQKWLDQSQSLNLYIASPSGKKLDELFKLAWQRGLKTTYYLRSLGATKIEKTGLRALSGNTEIKACLIDDPECEACQ